MSTPLSERERQVLEAVIDAYVQTAEPAASRTVAKRLGLGLSPATIRNTMSDLEEKGYLYHPHTSAGRIPTDIAYRVYVDSLMHPSAITRTQADQIREELSGERSAVDQLLYRAAQVLGVLTRELGVAVGPSLENAVLERLELIQVSSERLLLVLTLKERLAADAVAQVAVVLNERLAGLTLREIRATLADRLRDAAPATGAGELINIFIQEAGELFDMPSAAEPHGSGVVLSGTQRLAGQPEFATTERLQGLLEVTERRDLLRQALAERLGAGLTVTIGGEHQSPQLAPFTLVTAPYRSGPFAGVIGVLGPTRMPYDKIVALVDHTSRLLGELME
ncbi:MAG: heat-inducible transcription repressor HrcA [Gemmatimonadetes bacterium 13_1_40CM_2_70_7]|nr:MAG: heat-inducible transcription repressor HrcA [Gemmatimonadetes bacterium 13_1_40CM_2_70_7]